VIRPTVSIALLVACAAACSPRAPVLPSPASAPSEAPSDAEPAWSVEVHSGDDATGAEDVASAARLRFDEPVVVERIGGDYHVRVGAFRTEADARALAEVARERGFRSARAVRIRAAPPAGS